MRKLFTILAVVACLGLAGCATAGKDFNEALVQKLVIGQSSKEDAIALFGTPNGVSVANGVETLWWTHAKSSAFTFSTTGKSLLLTFDKDGILTGHHSNKTESGL